VSLDFCAIDFETANGRRGSACSVGMTRVRDGEIITEEAFLIRPHPSLGRFHLGNIAVHGITPDMLDAAGAPHWEDALEQILDFLGRDMVVAHNAPFDASVMTAASEAAGLWLPRMDFQCTVRLARRVFPDSPDHKLNTVAAYLGLGDFQHHDAGADARMCALICLAAADHRGYGTVEDMMECEGFSPILLGV
jgi:DNA polymerase-3 subunit epsilon